MKPLLVGETNPYGGDPYFALYPQPDGCAGYRLCVKVMGLREHDYLQRFDRVNLCSRDWHMKEARERATYLYNTHLGTWVHETMLEPQPRPKPIVLLGAKVCGAFDIPFEPFRIVHAGTKIDDRGAYNSIERSITRKLLPLVILPHPSGLSRAWNEPGAFERARAVLREAGVL